jgi:hypothetical protein
MWSLPLFSKTIESETEGFGVTGFSNWTIDNNTFNGCGAGSSQADVFVAACAPIYDRTTGLPTKDGNPILSGQPFADGKITNNRFLQHNEPHHGVEMYGFDGLIVQHNTIEMVKSFAAGTAAVGASDVSGLCGDLCGSLDGFDVTSDNGAHVHGWAVDVKLSKPNISSYLPQLTNNGIQTAHFTPDYGEVRVTSYLVRHNN